jgi:hypothetical protein
MCENVSQQIANFVISHLHCGLSQHHVLFFCHFRWKPTVIITLRQFNCLIREYFRYSSPE